jgi:glycosyltransferase involved in cell wall biosynthesis
MSILNNPRRAQPGISWLPWNAAQSRRRSESPTRVPVKVLVVGQTPPPYHGQAVMIERLLQSPLDGVRLFHVRMAFSRSISDLGRVQPMKLLHLPMVILKILYMRLRYGIDVLYYPPSGPSVVPVLKDIAILLSTRWLFRATILHIHAGGTSLVYPRLSGWLKPWFRWAFYGTSAVIRLSGATPEDGIGLQARREFLVANGIPDAFAPRQTSGSPCPLEQESYLPQSPSQDVELRLLYVGALNESKGVLDLVRACDLLAKKGRRFRLELVGQCQSDAFRRELEQLIDTLGLNEQIRQLGVLTGDAKYDRFADADVFCFPSFYECEAFPLVLLEALSFRLPVVATRWRGIPSIIRDEQTGFLVGTHCPEEVALRLEQLAADARLRRRMAAEARRCFLKEYTQDVFARRMEQVFHEVGAAL